MLGLLVVGILFAGSPGYGQEPELGAPPAVPVLNGSGPEVVPIVTRAGVHDDFGRIVFDWPWAVAYGAQIEGKTLTVMFDRRLHTTFRQIPQNLGAYITDIDLGPDGQSVVASLTGEYRLRTFLLNSEDGGVKVVVDLLADGGAGPMLAQAPVLPLLEPSPAAVPGDASSPTISGDPPPPISPNPQSPAPPLPPGLPFAVEADPAPEAAQQVETEAAPEETPQVEAEATPETASEEAPPAETATIPHPGPLRLDSGQALPEGEGEEAETVSPSPPEIIKDEGSDLAAAPSVTADADAPPAEPDSTPESVPTAEATPPVETTAAPEPVTEPAPEAAPPAEPTPETASEEISPVETAEVSPHPDPLPEGEGEGVAPTPATPSEETAAAPEDTPSTETAKPAAKEAPPVATDPVPQPPTPNPESLTPNSQIPTLPVSVRIPVSQSRLFRLDTPVASVFVANPEIADVQLVSSGVLFVVAKAVGRTSVAALDADSELVGQWTIATVLDIQPARAAIEGVPALKNVVVRQLNRGVELSGTVASIATADLALRLTTTALPEETPVENRISVTGKQQVNLEVQIAEVQRSVSETLGFNWEVLPDIGVGRGLGMRVGRFFFSEATGFISQGLPGGQAAALFGSTGVSPGRTTVRGLIDALATAGLATVLARPNVTAVSGETASFFSGGEYPLPSGFEDGAIIFEYKKYGVLLDFVPTIIDSGRIMLTVRPEVSQRSDTDSLTVVGIDIPVINVRRAETTVEVGDGESIVIAGLYRDQSEAVEAGLPVVKDIPLLGLLFGTQSVRSNATELIVVVTARLTTATTMPRTTDRDRQLPGRRLHGYHY